MEHSACVLDVWRRLPFGPRFPPPQQIFIINTEYKVMHKILIIIIMSERSGWVGDCWSNALTALR